MPQVFNYQTTVLKKMFLPRAQTIGDASDADAYYNEKIAQAKDIMNPFILRRLKMNVLKDLPSKTSEVIICEMASRQKEEYAKLLVYYKKRKSEFLEAQQRLEAAANVPKIKVKPEEVDRTNIISEKRKIIAQTNRLDQWEDDELDEKSDSASNDSDSSIIELGVGEASNDSTETRSTEGREMIKLNDELLTEDNQAGEFFGKSESHRKEEKKGSILGMITNMRKAANHPLLNRTIFTDEKLKEMAGIIMKQSDADTRFDYLVEDMTVMNDFELNDLCSFYTGMEDYKISDDVILDSAKFRKLDKLLDEIKKSGDRVLIFSQFKIMLNILEVYLRVRHHRFIRLDGSTAVEERQELIDEYNSDKDIFVFILTTRAGGVGINLTGANRVIIHDIDYNPQNDKQAEDRCHRVGQNKEVQVYKLITKDSIDETLLAIQISKLQLDDALSNNGLKKLEILKLFHAILN